MVAFGVVVFLPVGNSWGLKVSPSALKILTSVAPSNKVAASEDVDWDDSETLPAYFEDQSDEFNNKHDEELLRTQEMIDALRERNPGDPDLAQLERVEKALLGIKDRLAMFEEKMRQNSGQNPGKTEVFMIAIRDIVKELCSTVKSFGPSFFPSLLKSYIVLQAIPLIREAFLLIRDEKEAVKSLMAMVTMSIVSIVCVYWKKIDSDARVK